MKIFVCVYRSDIKAMMTQRGILLEHLEVLDRSRRGYLSNITKLCHQLDENLGDFGNVARYEPYKLALIPRGSSIVFVLRNTLIYSIPAVKGIKES